ncbi:VanW family protein [Janibacter sp. GXQ6167]|uniref:VanW family protein n=1 Tax=Janibacter sp. GXQ6167 TaxID=3240791 RepID=UPI003525CA67
MKPKSETADKSGRGRVVLAGVFVLLVLAGLYVAAAWFLAGRIPPDTRVGGVNIGGMSENEARAALDARLGPQSTKPIEITVGDESQNVDPADLGLALDYDAALADLTSFSLNPVHVWDQIRSGQDHDAAADADPADLAERLSEPVAALESDPVEGTVAVEDAKVKTTASKPGVGVDREALAKTILGAWPARRAFPAPTVETEPTLQQAEIERFTGEVLEPLLSGPVTVKTKGAEDKDVSFPVTAAALSTAVGIDSKDGRLDLTVDDKKLVSAVTKAGDRAKVLVEPRDATVVAKGSMDFEVKPSRNGLTLRGESVVASVPEAWTKEGDARTATVESTVSKPKVTTAKAKETIPNARISTFSSDLPANPTRTHNIKIAAREIDGTYVAPGETFSLNKALGERTAAKGYNKAGVIVGGRLREDYGGGISQLSTTLFNAIFFSGAKIEEFHPHSFYISRYPEGREATISWPDVDNRFTNDTKGGILIRASATDSKVTVSFYGRKTWDVKAVKGPRTNVTQPKTIRDNKPGCVSQSPHVGFTVTVTRIFSQGGKEVKRSDFTTRYIASDQVICG